MLIGELAKKTGLSKDTIRFYQKIGLIQAGDRAVGTRTYLEFSPEIQETVELIAKGKSLGFTLGEIKHLIDAWSSGNMSIESKREVVDRKLADITHKIQQLEEIKLYLQAKRDLMG